MQFIALLVAIVLPACLAVTPVPALNASAYLGRWYQMYDNDFAKLTFERNAVWFVIVPVWT